MCLLVSDVIMVRRENLCKRFFNILALMDLFTLVNPWNPGVYNHSMLYRLILSQQLSLRTLLHQPHQSIHQPLIFFLLPCLLHIDQIQCGLFLPLQFIQLSLFQDLSGNFHPHFIHIGFVLLTQRFPMCTRVYHLKD